VQYALLQAQVLELEAERCRSAQEFWAIFEHTLRRVGFVDKGESDAEYDIQVKYNGSTPWTLYAPQHKGTQVEWQRIAECFGPVLTKAKQKWRA
jgi:hypothetical protein